MAVGDLGVSGVGAFKLGATLSSLRPQAFVCEVPISRTATAAATLMHYLHR